MKDDVVVTVPQAIGISSYGKAPNAAKLVVDFVLSAEGQSVLRRSGRVPANPKVDPDPPELTRGRKLFYSDIIDGGTRYNELNNEFLKLFGAPRNILIGDLHATTGPQPSWGFVSISTHRPAYSPKTISSKARPSASSCRSPPAAAMTSIRASWAGIWASTFPAIRCSSSTT